MVEEQATLFPDLGWSWFKENVGIFKRRLGKFQIVPNHPCFDQSGVLCWWPGPQLWWVAGVVNYRVAVGIVLTELLLQLRQ